MRIEFKIKPFQSTVFEVIPVLDAVSLTERIERFEQAAGFDCSIDSYRGLIPAYFRFGSAADHYFATARAFTNAVGKVPLLGCECGEWGCWPLLARIDVGEESVSWVDFEQPFRKERDYSGFGPFVFSRTDYDSAVARLAPTWDVA